MWLIISIVDFQPVINPLMPEWNSPWLTPNSLAFFGFFQSEQLHLNGTYLLVTEFAVRTVSYEARSMRAINPSGKKRGAVTYSTDRENEVSKTFIISLVSKRWRRFQSSGTANDDWRTSNSKREDNLLVSTKSNLSRQNVCSNFKFISPR